LKKLRSAARALLHGDGKISEKRRQELIDIIHEELPYYEEEMKLRTSENGGEGDGAGDSVKTNGTGNVQSLQDLPLDDILPTLRNIDVRYVQCLGQQITQKSYEFSLLIFAYVD